MTPHEQHVPAAIRKRLQWVGWRYETRDGKKTKVPINPHTGRNAKTNDPATWSDYDTAVAAAAKYGLAGVGCVFADDDPFSGIDIDDCRDPESGIIAPWVQEIIDTVPTYWEVSPSRTGVKGWVGAIMAGTRHRWKLHGGEVEIYDQKRFFTFTGQHLPDSPLEIEERQGELEALIARLDGQRAVPRIEVKKQPEKTDEAILEELSRSEKTAPLLEGDLSAYNDDHSKADLALCGAIARLVSGDRERVDGVFRKTVLMREKWDERHASDGTTYGQMTIAKALEVVVQPAGAGQKEILLSLATGLKYFHTPEAEGFVVVPIDDHLELFAVIGRDFSGWLRHQYYLKERRGAGAPILKDVQTTLDAGARYAGEERRIGVRMMEHEGALYLNLANERREAVRITAKGWEVVENPLLFRQTNSMRALPHPEPGGSLAAMRSCLNLEDDDDFILAVAWLVGALHARGPYPILIVQGEQGSGKSTTSRLLRSLVDPAMPDLKSLPSSDRDLMVAARGSWVLAYDNLSSLLPGKSDALCRLATGGGLSTRQLYTDAEEIVFDAKRPILINGIDDLTQRADLLSRAIVLTLPSIEPEKRRTEGAVFAEFEALRPKLLGALCDAVACALAHENAVKLKTMPRMSDFATWVVAAEEQLSWEEGRFLIAFVANGEAMSAMALELDRVGMRIIEVMEGVSEWTGTASEILKVIRGSFGEELHGKDIPASPRALANRLRRLAPQLKQRGITVEFRKGTERHIIITNAHGTIGHYIVGDAHVKVRPDPRAEK